MKMYFGLVMWINKDDTLKFSNMYLIHFFLQKKSKKQKGILLNPCRKTFLLVLKNNCICHRFKRSGFPKQNLII
jgi:hypothetical protein